MDIKAHSLGKQFGRDITALHDITLDWKAGTVNGLLGPNGAGKTTLLRLCATLEQPSTGTLSIMSRDITQRQERRHIRGQLGYLPQEFQLYDELNCDEFLAYAATLKELDTRTIRREVRRVLEAVNLTREARRKIGTLSGGMKQRVGLAQALLGHPRLLILDEPTGGLDPEERGRLRNLLASMADSCLIILSTHIVEDVAQICSHVTVLHQGRLAFQGTPEALSASPKGHVWEWDSQETLTTLTIPGSLLLSSRAMTTGTRYRVWSETKPHSTAQQVEEPTLADGYLCLGIGAESEAVAGM